MANTTNCSCCFKRSDIPDELQSFEDDGVVVFSSTSEVFEKLSEKSQKKDGYAAMYSSVFGGIVVDPALMFIPIDDHMVHRGHGVFDTATIFNGFLYELDEHLERFLRSAAKAKIASLFPPSTLRSILIRLAAVSECREGTLRFWLSSGPGSFSLTPGTSTTPAFYAVVINEALTQWKRGVEVITTSTPMKPPPFGTVKSVNYLPNVLARMEAEEKGAFASVWVDDEGHVAEGPNMNLAFITQDKKLILPAFENILRGCTAVRLLELAPRLVEQGRLKSVGVGNLTVDEAKNAAEMMYVGTGFPIAPIVLWDGNPIGDGKIGELTMALSDLLWEDLVAGPETKRIPIEAPSSLLHP